MDVLNKLKVVPHLPGCYLMSNKDGIIIYVGKAKNLYKRLQSYFNKEQMGKTRRLVANIASFDYIVTSTEKEALVLELNLIKKHDPKYNIKLTDDKTYPYIELTNEKYPVLQVVRNINRRSKQSNYFGPYPNVYAARRVVNLLNRLYPLRKCKNLSKKECLYFHIDECLGYCKNDVNKDLIQKMIFDILKFLKGDPLDILKKIKQDMYEASQKCNYERAHELKKMLEYVEIITEKQKIDLNTNEDIDIFGYYENKGFLSIQIMFIRGGRVISNTASVLEIIDDKEEEIYEFIVKFYAKGFIQPKIIMVQNDIIKEDLNIVLTNEVIVPKRGPKKKLLDLAKQNAKESLNANFEMIKKDEAKTIEAINELEHILNIDNIGRIESFDNSHLFGSYAVSGMIVYIDGKPSKKEYRKFNITTPKSNSDVDIFKEVIYRRYFRVLKDNLERPDLIMVDGGIHQINATREVLEGFKLNIPVVGLQKDDKHNTCELLGGKDVKTIKIDKKGNLFHLLTRIQEDTHRYTISYNINLRSKGALSSILDYVPGLGIKRKSMLLKKYGSLNQMQKITKEEFQTILPEKVANNLYDILKEM